MNGCVVHVLSGQPYDFYIGRQNPRYGFKRSPWANRFKVGEHGDPEAVLSQFAHAWDQSVEAALSQREQPWARSFLAELAALDGKTLACWCPDKDGGVLTLEDPIVCHGQILLKLAAELTREAA